MTAHYAGAVATAVSCPHVYFIVSGDLLYVGETQRHPVIRWCAHLQATGSFTAAVALQEEFADQPLDEVGFFAFRLDQLVVNYPAIQFKQVTQAIEHELHVLLRSRPSVFGGRFRLISDTAKTAPRKFKDWDLARKIARDIADSAAPELARYAA